MKRIGRIETLEKRMLLTTYVVDSLLDVEADDGQLTLREAVRAATLNTEVDGQPAGSLHDVIRFKESLFNSGSQTITLNGGSMLVSPNASFNGSNSDTFDHVNVAGGSISIEGPGSDMLTIDAGTASSIFVVVDEVDISGMALTGSDYTAPSMGGGFLNRFEQDTNGVAIVNAAGTSLFSGNTINIPVAYLLSLDDVWIYGNEGGGVYNGQGGLTVQNSIIENNGFSSSGTINAMFGGGIHVEDGFTITGSEEDDARSTNAIIENSIIRGNRAQLGGGIANESAELFVYRSSIVDNIARKKLAPLQGESISNALGGGIVTQAKGDDITFNSVGNPRTLVIESVVKGNQADRGGGVSNRNGWLTVGESLIDNNMAFVSAGGISTAELPLRFESTETIIRGTTVSSNSAPIGGGLDNYGSDTTITGSTFSFNTSSGNGGGIVSRAFFLSGQGTRQPQTKISNTTISANTAADFGGGIYHDPQSQTAGDATLSLTNVTVTGNRSNSDGASPGNGGGLAINETVGVASSTSIVNSLVAGNTTGAEASAVHSDIHALTTVSVGTNSNNLIGDPASAGGVVDGTNGNIVGDSVGNAWEIDRLLFTQLADNLGNPAPAPLFLTSQIVNPPAVHSLKLDSPAIDAGTSTGTPLFDQRGFPFLRANQQIGDAGRESLPVDIGAYESQLRPIFRSSELVVTTFDDESDGDFSPGDLSLREAIEIANMSPDSNGIRFDRGLIDFDNGSTITLSSPIEVLYDTAITGPGSDFLTLSGGNTTRLLEIGPQATTTISDLTISGGSGVPGTTTFGVFEDVKVQGGAVYNAGNTTIHEVVFLTNNASPSSNPTEESGGGAISNQGMMTIYDTEFRNNSGLRGGAIQNGMGESEYRAISLSVGPNVYFGNNEATEEGGAIRNEADLYIIDSEFNANMASSGGAISSVGVRSSAEIRQSSIHHNAALAGHGGAIDARSSLMLIDSSIELNRALNFTGEAAGGGIYLSGSGESEVIIDRTTIYQNLAEGETAAGGGLHVGSKGRSIQIISSTISTNSAVGFIESRGGGVSVGSFSQVGFSTYPLVQDSTIAFNSAASQGAGVYLATGIRLGNSIISDNSGAAEQLYLESAAEVLMVGQFQDFSTNLLDKKSQSIITSLGGVGTPVDRIRNEPGNLAGAFLTDDPGLGPIGDFGGAGLTHQITTPTSQAIDNGQRLGLLDQRGFPVTDQASSAFDGRLGIGDIGAYEVSQVQSIDFRTDIRDASQFGPGDAFVHGFGFDLGRPSNISKEPGFLGIKFDETFALGPGIAKDAIFGTQWGGEATGSAKGKIGLEYGYYVNSGSVDTYYDGTFTYAVNETSPGVFTVGTGTTLNDGGLFTASPRASGYVDFVFDLDAAITGTACSVTCISGTVPLKIDESLQLFAINRQEKDKQDRPLFITPDGTKTHDSNGGLNQPAFDGKIEVVDVGLPELLNIDLGLEDADDLLKKKKGTLSTVWSAQKEARQAAIDKKKGKAGDHDTKIKNANKTINKATAKKAGASAAKVAGGIGLVVSAGKAEGSLLGAKVDVGIGASLPGVSAAKQLGSVAVTLPDVQLSDTTFDNAQGKLSATTDDFKAGSELDSKRQLAALTIDASGLGSFSQVAMATGLAPLLGTTDLTAGPLGLSVTPVGYTVTPRLAITQDASVEPFFDADHQASFDFTFTGGGTIDVFVGDSASPQAIASGGMVSFMPGTEIRVEAGSKNVSITPSIKVGNRFSNDIGLDVDVSGTVELLKAQLNAFGKKVFGIGPVFTDTHTLIDSIDLGSIFDKTFNLPATTNALTPFTLTAQQTGSTRDGASPAGALLLKSGTAKSVTPIANETTYLEVPLVDASGVRHTDVRFVAPANRVVSIRPPYGGMTLELLDGSGNLTGSFDIDVNGADFSTGTKPTHWRLKGFSPLLGDQAVFGVKFDSTAPASVTATSEGGTPLTSVGERTDNLVTLEKQEAFEAISNVFITNSDFALDIDSDGILSPTTDGTLISRFLSGQSGATLIAGITSSDVATSEQTRTSASDILAYLAELEAIGRLDVDNDGSSTADVDGVLILRHMAGIGGTSTTEQALTDGLTLAGSRTLPSDIRAFIDGGRSPGVNETFAGEVRSDSTREAPSDLIVSENAVTGSSPYKPAQAAFSDGTGIYTLDTYNANVTLEKLYLSDEAPSNGRTLVRVKPEGAPARRISVPASA